MNSIKYNINKTFLKIIIVTQVLTFIIFNTVIIHYKNIAAKSELENISKGIETAMFGGENTVTTLPNYMLRWNRSPNRPIDENVEILELSTYIAMLSDNLLFAIINDKDHITYVSDDAEDTPYFRNSEKNSDLVNYINIYEENEIIPIGNIFNRQYFMYASLNKILSNHKVIYISNNIFARNLMWVMDIALLLILVSTSILGLIFIKKLSKTISSPLSVLTESALQIEKGNYITIEENTSSTEIYSLIGQINKMSRSLENYDDVQKKFLQDASHELKTPLMSIQGYAEGIENEVFSNPKEIACHITEESKRLNRLVEQLLTLSRIENENYSNNFEIINIADISKDYVQRLEGLAMKSNKKIELISDDEVYVNIDEDLMAQIFTNIISNGLKYAKTKVCVNIKKIDGFAVITFIDDGEGILEKDLPHVFDRFYKGKNGNYGLGLAISKTAVKYMKGKISAYNEDGAAFKIEFELKKAPFNLY